MGTQKVCIERADSCKLSWISNTVTLILGSVKGDQHYTLQNPCLSFKRRQSHKDKHKECDPGSLEAKKGYKCFNQVAPQGQLWPRAGSLEDSWISPPSDDPDRKQAEPLSLYTCILLKNIASNREECVLCSRPVRRGLMATASRHGSYWHRASKTACKHLHCYELWSSWLMQ